MKIDLTKNQLKLVKEEIESLHEKESLLNKKRDEGLYVSGWDFESIYSERSVLNDIIKNGSVDTYKIN